MGIPGGLLQFAANAVKPALEVETGRNQAQLAASQQRQQQLLQMIMLQRQEREDAVANALKQAQTGSANATAAYRTSQANRPQAPVLGSPEYLNAKINEAKALNALKPTPPPAFGSPGYMQTEEELAKMRAKYRPPTQEPLQQVQQPDGSVVYVPRSQAAGGLVPQHAGSGAGGAQAMSRAGQFGEMLKQSVRLIPKMQSLDVTLGQSSASDVAQHGFGVGGLRIPGSAGLGSMLVNRSPEFAEYQTMLDPFVLANAHALSGARINQDQARMIKQSIEMKPSDPTNVRQSRIQNVINQMNSTAASLPPDLVAAQEAQMDPGELSMLRQMGYRGHGSGSAPQAKPAPSGPTGTPDLTDVAAYLKYLRSGTP